MPKLNDTQSILLSSAAQRDHGSLFPLPKTITAGSRVNTALASIIKAGFAEERQISDATCMYRQDGDQSVGVFITAAGLAAIGVTEGRGDEAPVPAAAPEPATTKPSSKRDAVIALLARDGGATVAELIAATGWLPHTTRAALTGLRKAGHEIARGKREDGTCYSIAPAVSA